VAPFLAVFEKISSDPYLGKLVDFDKG